MSDHPYMVEYGQLHSSDVCILFQEQRIVIRGNRVLWSAAELERLVSEDSAFLRIGGAERDYFAVALPQLPESSPEIESCSLRSLLFDEFDVPFEIVGKANQILDWYSSHRYCGACGSPTRHHEFERAVFCPSCERQFYPRINPCVIVLVLRGKQALLARSARFKSGFLSCLAGFIEVGESAEDTIHREVKEEVGLEVENLRYLKSQSWPFPSQLMLGYLADYKSGEIVPEPGEIEEADWYDVDDLPNVPAPGVSVAGELILHWINQVKSGRL